MHTCYCNENSRNPGLQLDPTQQINSKPKQQNRIRHNLPKKLVLPETGVVAANRNYETYVVVLKLKTAAPVKVLRHAPVDVLLFLTSEKPFVFGGREVFCAAEFREEGGCNRWEER
ncbi:hypothetical protein MtrunA17_Chr2g0330851 [Medicago truncatula]|uniref:Uncharacterized protein n=1 Tax=Medicago truncatula TaxID=3880 RepID=G7IHY3_MEDTR|nr:hypothetical protein MTR_2g100690 [Medicago truncatula]RHN76331.1 hypothetical protein MtrunA17_Chr2g0330851 [Medicago truncatula]